MLLDYDSNTKTLKILWKYLLFPNQNCSSEFCNFIFLQFRFEQIAIILTILLKLVFFLFSFLFLFRLVLAILWLLRLKSVRRVAVSAASTGEQPAESLTFTYKYSYTYPPTLYAHVCTSDEKTWKILLEGKQYLMKKRAYTFINISMFIHNIPI